MYTELISVLMSVYKGENSKYLTSALESLLNQTYKNFQVVLVEDGELNADLYGVINSFRSRVDLKSVVLKNNVGLASALNEGLKYCNTDFTFRMDTDDIALPHRFSDQINLLIQGYDLVGSYIQEFDESGFHSMRVVPLEHSDIVASIRLRNPFNHMTVAFRTNSVLSVGGYPNIHLKEDYALWALLLTTPVRAINVSDVLVYARTNKNFYRRRGGLKYVVSEFHMQKLLVHYNYNSFISSFFVFCFRSFVFLSPSTIRSLVYKRFLRKSI